MNKHTHSFLSCALLCNTRMTTAAAVAAGTTYAIVDVDISDEDMREDDEARLCSRVVGLRDRDRAIKWAELTRLVERECNKDDAKYHAYSVVPMHTPRVDVVIKAHGQTWSLPADLPLLHSKPAHDTVVNVYQEECIELLAKRKHAGNKAARAVYAKQLKTEFLLLKTEVNQDLRTLKPEQLHAYKEEVHICMSQEGILKQQQKAAAAVADADDPTVREPGQTAVDTYFSARA